MDWYKLLEMATSIHRECLKRNHQLLVDTLDPRDVADYLYQEGQINSDQLEEYTQSCVGRARKEIVREMLLSLQKRPDGYGVLVQAFQKSDIYGSLAQALDDTEKSLREDSNIRHLENFNTIMTPPPSYATVSDIGAIPQSPSQLNRQDNYRPERTQHLRCLSTNANVSNTNGCTCDVCCVQTTTKHTEPRMDIHFPEDAYEANISESLANDSNGKHGVYSITGLTAAKMLTSENYSVQCSDANSADVIGAVPHGKVDDLSLPNFGLLCSMREENSAGNLPPVRNGIITKRPEKIMTSNLKQVKQSTDPTLEFLDNLTRGQNSDSCLLPTQAFTDHDLSELCLSDSQIISHSDYEADTELNDSDYDRFSEDELEYCLPSSSNAIIAMRMSTMYTMTSANQFVNKKQRYVLSRVFDSLSTMINQGEYAKFNAYRRNLIINEPSNHDLKFLLLYLSASSHLWQNEYDKCDQVVHHALQVVSYTSRPSRALVEILSSRAWMYFQQKKYNRLKVVLDDALKTIAQDPGECVGMAAGWIYVDQARLLSALMLGGDADRIRRMRLEGIECLEKALQHFKADGSKDGPFGYGFAGIMLASFLLVCGDHMHTAHVVPSDEDITRARLVITEVEDLPSGIPGVLLVHVLIAKCDYNFRRGAIYFDRAMDHAKQAIHLAGELSMPELKEYADIRLSFLQSHTIIESTTRKDSMTKSVPISDASSEEQTSNKNKTYSTKKHNNKERSFVAEHSCAIFYILTLLVALVTILGYLAYTHNIDMKTHLVGGSCFTAEKDMRL